MTSVIDEFIADARMVDLEEIAALCGVTATGRTDEKKGPCPRCGGKDRFSINYSKGLWNCGHLGGAGGDGLALVAHCFDYDLRRRADLLAACAQILGKCVPEGGERETDEERAARAERVAAIRAKAALEATERANEANAFRDRAIQKAQSLYGRAMDGRRSSAFEYLRLRTGYRMPDQVFDRVRFADRYGYWHGRDDRGHAVERHVGPAMIAPFIDSNGALTGCHETWIDLSQAPKFRPNLGCDEAGAALVTKKMQGSVKGSLIPLLGSQIVSRWVGGEGIENVLAVAGSEGFRDDTFYFSAGSLGNLCGPSDADSNFDHPTQTKVGQNGRLYPVRVPGIIPRPDSDGDAVFIADHVTLLILVCDGDSEPIKTAADIARAKRRFMREGRIILDWWPPRGRDWSSVILDGLTKMGRAA